MDENRFNTALEYFLACLSELKRHVESCIAQYPQSANEDRSTKAIVYPIKDNKINNISIRWKYSESHDWTKAMKYFLTNLQWLIYQCQKKDLYDQAENLDFEQNA